MVKHLKIKNLILLFSFSILISSCKYQDIVVGDIHSTKLDEINSEKITINLMVPVKNPNSYKIKIIDYDIDVDVNSQIFELVEYDKKIIIPKKYSGIMQFPISLSKSGVISFKTIKTVYQIFSKKNIYIKATGYVTVKALLVRKKIFVNEKRTINLKGNK